MRPGDVEKLLGGYATGTLSEAERKALFEAALSDQHLFDALAEEEALLEALADPQCRRQLLGLLQEERPPLSVRVAAWARRPTPWALGGALAGAVLVATAVLHVQDPPPVAVIQRTKAVEPPVAFPPPPATPAIPTEPPERPRLAVQRSPAVRGGLPPQFRPPAVAADTKQLVKTAPAMPPAVATPAAPELGGVVGGVPSATVLQAPEQQIGSSFRTRNETADMARPYASAPEDARSLYYASGTRPEPGKPAASPYGFTGGTRVVAGQRAGPLGIRCSVLRKDAGGEYREADPDGSFRPGDAIRLAVEANARGFLYVLRQDASGGWIPVPGTPQNRVEVRTRYVFPTAGALAPGNFVVLFSREPQAEFQAVGLEQSRRLMVEKVRQANEIAVFVVDPAASGPAARVRTEIRLGRQEIR